MAMLIKNFKHQTPNMNVVDQWIRVHQPAATNPATTSRAIFTVTGRCLVKLFLGEVTTVQQTQTNNTSITFTPTGGANADIASNLDTTADAAGTYYLVEGDGTALVSPATIKFVNLTTTVDAHWVIDSGTIYWKTSATSTGAVAWTIYYIPLDPGAEIRAV